MTPKEILIAADALLADESKWCKHALARDGEGRLANPDAPGAERWCVEGAVSRVCSPGWSENSIEAMALLDGTAESRGFGWSIHFNDAESTTFADIKSLFADAIKEAS